MKLGGRKIEGPNTETIVIPRSGEREDLVFVAQAVLDYNDFDKLCPTPKAPVRMLPGGERQEDVEDARYKERMDEYGRNRMAWMILKSLSATAELEWERVDWGKPSTWHLWEDEFREAGLSAVEIGRIRRAVWVANCLDEDKLEEARRSFLAGRRKLSVPSSSQRDEQSDTPSGEPVSDSESVLPISATPGTKTTSGSKPA